MSKRFSEMQTSTAIFVFKSVTLNPDETVYSYDSETNIIEDAIENQYFFDITVKIEGPSEKVRQLLDFFRKVYTLILRTVGSDITQYWAGYKIDTATDTSVDTVTITFYDTYGAINVSSDKVNIGNIPVKIRVVNGNIDIDAKLLNIDTLNVKMKALVYINDTPDIATDTDKLEIGNSLTIYCNQNPIIHLPGYAFGLKYLNI